MPAKSRSLSRRAVFRLTAGAALGAVGLTATAGCATGEDTAATVDTLTTHLRRARSDSAAAESLIVSRPELTDALTVVRSERSAHADALAAEIDRVAGGSSTSTPSPEPTTAAPTPSLDELVSGLNDSARGAAQSARDESGYRAGLLGSISAACAVQVAVVLA